MPHRERTNSRHGQLGTQGGFGQMYSVRTEVAALLGIIPVDPMADSR